ncbi:MAG: helix-turn-helix domain-containing protein [Pigmentiphaga sp.]
MPSGPPPIPRYALYGEFAAAEGAERLHCESIPARSRLHQWEIQPHWHAYFLQILYIREGGGVARLEDREQDLKAPCVLVVPAGCVHGFRFLPETDGQVMTAVQASLPAALVGAFAEPVYLGLTPDEPRWRRLDVLVTTLVEAFGSVDAWRGAALQGALHVVLAQLAAAHGEAPSTGEAGRARQHVRRYYRLVEQHFRQHREIGFYAGALGMTSTQLNRVCRAERGLSALAVIQRRLLAEAERELAYTSLSIKEVALELGFQDAAYFSRFFVRQSGRTPTDFRLAAQQRFAQGMDAPATAPRDSPQSLNPAG